MNPLIKSPEDLFVVMNNITTADKELITKAFHFAKEAHEGQKRYSGEPYFNHVFATAMILAKMGMRSQSVAAGLLHDTVEDTPVTEDELNKEFGDEILFLVDGVTKLGEIKFKGATRHVDSLRKLFIATSKDIRVLIIKLADRLHNMRTLNFVPAEKQERIAKETLEVYAPIAHRLNIGKMKGELEDLSFKYIDPENYSLVLDIAKERYSKSEDTLKKIYKKLRTVLVKENIEVISTDYRRKHIWSLYKKLKRKDMDIERVYDISALRIVVKTVSECYQTLGLIHSLWRPLPGRVKDYIAFEKPNGYRSIHTTIFSGQGDLAEIQIRTEDMHKQAEYGIASHFRYKGAKSSTGGSSFDWIKSILPTNGASKNKNNQKPSVPEWIKEIAEGDSDQNRDGFIEELKKDYINQRIFVFTPNGDVIDLPVDSTPVDFAYHIHTSVGETMVSAKINGKMSSLDTKLKNGDIVSVQKKEGAKPNRKWLNSVQTNLARRKIKSALNLNQNNNKTD